MSHSEPGYRLWVNEARTLLVRQWASGEVEIAERDDPGMTCPSNPRCCRRGSTT